MIAVLPSTPKLRLVVACFLAALAVIAYLPAQLLPLIADDYVQIEVGRRYGPAAGWSSLAADTLYRCRATSIVLTHWTVAIFGFSPLALKASSLLIHILNVMLVAALGLWRPLGWRISLVAAAFFATAEGHQEAVIWYAAIPELLVFTFVLAAFLCWVMWIQQPERIPVFYAASLLLFGLALLSKESAVCLVGLLALSVLLNDPGRPRHWMAIMPFAALSAAYFASIYAAKSTHLHLNDGTFSLSAPFWITVPNSIGRMFWIWGLLAIGILLAARKLSGRFIFMTLAWMTITLLPYSFLTYMFRVPSRHTYLASVALAWIVGAAMLSIRETWPRYRHLSGALAVVIACQNVGYLWTRKQRQFAERAAPTHDLIKFSRSHKGPIYVRCFPYHADVARLALLYEGESAGRLRWVNSDDCSGHSYQAAPAVASAAPSVARSEP